MTGAPTAGDDRASTPEDVPLQIDLLANDQDPDGDALTLATFPDPTNGSIACSSSGRCTYVPARDFFGQDRFTYTVTDGAGSDVGNVTIDVLPVNDPPAATDDAASTPEDQPVVTDVLDNDGDPDGDPLRVVAWTPAASGTVACDAGGSCTYTPAPDFHGNDGFGYTVDDGAGGRASARVSVRVTPVNDPPDAMIDSPASPVTILPGESVSFAGSARDPDDVVLVHLWSFPGGVPASSALEDPGLVTFPLPGTFTVTYGVVDGAGAFDPTPATVTVHVNQPPDARIDTPAGDVTVLPGQGVSFSGTATDPDGAIAAHVWTFPGGAPASSALEDPGLVVFTSPGEHLVTYGVTDDRGSSDPSPDTRRITVAAAPPPANQPPDGRIDAPAGDVTVTAGASVLFAGSGSDADGTIAGYAWSFPGGAPASSVLEDPGAVVFNEPGAHVVTLTVTDEDGAADPTPDTRRITIVPAGGGGGGDDNVPPDGRITSPAGDVTILAGGSVPFAGTASDEDGRIVSYAWSFGGGAPSSARRDPGLVRFDRPGVFAVTFTATDDEGASDPTPDRRTVTVTRVNAPPQAEIDEPAGPVTIRAGESVAFAGSSSDPDGSVVAWFWDFGGGAVNRNVEDPGPTAFPQAGRFTVRYNVTDNAGASDPSPPEVVIEVLGIGGGGGTVQLDVETEAPGSAGRVDGHDVLFVLRAVASQDLRADVNGDGRVDAADVQAVQSALGEVD
ncbi:MAG: Ig-like domain-containing protein [Gemmatimonadota bacterium]